MYTGKAKLLTFIHKSVTEMQRRNLYFRRLLLLPHDLYARALCPVPMEISLNPETAMVGHFMSATHDRYRKVVDAFQHSDRVVMEIYATGNNEKDLGVEILFWRGSTKVFLLSFCYHLEQGLVGPGFMGDPKKE